MNAKSNSINQLNKYGKTSTPFLFIIDFDAKNIHLFDPQKAADDGISFFLNGITNYTSPLQTKKNMFHFIKKPVEFKEYEKAFKKIQKQVGHGNTYLLNLTFPTRIETNLSLPDIFKHSRAKYRLLYKGKFVVFSPETFVQIKNNRIASYPMKGTIDASQKDAADLLLSDEKELAEHNTIVDLIRNDLSMVAKNVRVEKFRYIDHIKTHEGSLLQTSSKIVGDLSPDWNEKIGNILLTLLPAGSISGAPKKKTVEIIKETEKYDRGYFTGIFGYFDGNSLDSAVLIRFIEKMGDQLYFKSGGGITSFSKCDREYRELIDKVYVPVV
jgi:para-aminobenzoate synthetase component 1